MFYLVDFFAESFPFFDFPGEGRPNEGGAGREGVMCVVCVVSVVVCALCVLCCVSCLDTYGMKMEKGKGKRDMGIGEKGKVKRKKSEGSKGQKGKGSQGQRVIKVNKR